MVLVLAACGPSDGDAPEGSDREGAQGSAPAREAWEGLEADLRARTEAAPVEVAVALVDLEGERRLGIRDTVVMHAASTMKVPVLLELWRQAEAGRLPLDRPVEVRNTFTSIADGSAYTLSAADDSDPGLYDRVGDSLPVRELARRMIARSSNLATNLLIELVTPEAVRATLRELGAGGMRVLRGVEDIPAYRRGMNNTTTARAFARVLEALARCEGVGARACDEMLEILEAQEFRERIPAAIPDGVRVANKTGWITEIDHDGAVVYPPGREPYVLVVLTRGIADTAASREVIREVSARVWETLGTGSAP